MKLFGARRTSHYSMFYFTSSGTRFVFCVVHFVLLTIIRPGHPVLGTLYATSCSELVLRMISSESVARALDPLSEDVSYTLFLRLPTDVSPPHWLAHSASVLQCLPL